MASFQSLGRGGRTVLGAVLLTMLAVPVVTFGSALPAAAQSCGHSSGSEAYSIAWYCGSSSGLEGQWHDNNMYLSTADYNSSGHITNEMWALTAVGWIETGLLNSANLWGANPCGCVAYQQFWADDNGNFYFHWLNNLSPDGNNHVYEILNRGGGSNYWDIYLDYSYKGTSRIQTTTTSYQTQVGLELFQGYGQPYVNSSSHADTFTNYIEDYSGSWFYPTWTSSWVDNGCNVYPQGDCLNGSIGGAGIYSDNKP